MSTGRYNGGSMVFLLILLALLPATAQQPRAKKGAPKPQPAAAAPATTAYPIESLAVEGIKE